MVFPEEWDFKAPITISAGQVAGTSGAFTDFPVLLTTANLPPDMLDADGPASAQNGGGDIRFTADADGLQPIPVDIRLFEIAVNPALGRANIAVRIPVLSKTQDTAIYVWWGTSGTTAQPAPADPLGRNAVYAALVSAGEGAVYANAELTDRTGNGFDLTKFGSVSTVTGLNGDAWRFDGDSLKGLRGNAPITGDGVPSTLSVLVTRETSTAQWRALIELASDSSNRFGLWYDPSDQISFWQAPSSSSSLVGPIPAFGAFSYISGVQHSAERRLLFNGALAAALSEAQHPSALTELNIGRRFDDTLPANSKIEEVRIAFLALSDDWIATEANNLRNAAVFASAGAVEDAGLGLAGTADPRLAGMAAMAMGHQRNDAAGGAFVSSLRATAGARLRHVGSAVSTARAPRSHAEGTLRINAAAGPAWGRLLAFASGVAALPVSGDLAAQLPELAATASGQRSFIAEANTSLPGLVCDGGGWIGLGPQPASTRLEIARATPRLVRARPASRKLTVS